MYCSKCFLVYWSLWLFYSTLSILLFMLSIRLDKTLKYLLKNILILANLFHNLKCIDKIKSSIRHIWWKVNFYNKKNFRNEITKKNFRFMLKNCPQENKELQDFTKNLYNIKNYRNSKDYSQIIMKGNITRIKAHRV